MGEESPLVRQKRCEKSDYDEELVYGIVYNIFI